MNEGLLKAAMRDLRQAGRRRPMTERQVKEWVSVMVSKADIARLVKIGEALGTLPCETLRRTIKMMERVVEGAGKEGGKCK